MKLYLGKNLLAILSVILLSIHLVHSFNLRSIGYDRIPEPFYIMDERTYIWQGLSIRKSGIPMGWIAELQSYPNRVGGNLKGFNITVNGVLPTLSNYKDFPKPVVAVVEMDYGKGIRHTQLIQPLIEKPPLGSLILGLGVPDKLSSIIDVSPTDFRRVTLYLALVTEILMFLLGWQLFKNPMAGLLSAVLYGSIPTFILLSHYALQENVLTPILLLMLNLLIFAKQNEGKYFSKLGIVLAAVSAGLSSLVKETGWFFILLGIFLLWFWKFPRRLIILFTLVAVSLGILYFLWVLYLAPDLFFKLFLAEGVNKGFVGSLNLLTSITKVNIINFPFEGWWLTGFISLLFIPKEKRYVPIFASIIAILLSALCLIGFNNPWYFMPLIPFMCLALTYLLWKVIFNPSLFEIMFFFLTIFSISFFWGYIVYKNPSDIPHYQYQPFNLYRILFVLFLGSGLVWEFLPKVKRFKIFWIILMIGIIYQTIIWNDRALFYILSHWGKIPSMFILGVE